MLTAGERSRPMRDEEAEEGDADAATAEAVDPTVAAASARGAPSCAAAMTACISFLLVRAERYAAWRRVFSSVSAESDSNSAPRLALRSVRLPLCAPLPPPPGREEADKLAASAATEAEPAATAEEGEGDGWSEGTNPGVELEADSAPS